LSRNFVLSLTNGQRPNYRLELTARLFLAERPQLSRSVSHIENKSLLCEGEEFA
jgi:hypothetical protein